MHIARGVVALLSSLAACVHSDPAEPVYDVTPFLYEREAEPRHDLEGAKVTLWQVEDSEKMWALTFRVSNLSDKTWSCAGVTSQRVRDRDGAVGMITDPDVYQLCDDDVWRVLRRTRCGMEAPPEPFFVAPGQAVIYYGVRHKDEERPVRFGASIATQAGWRTVCSETATDAFIEGFLARRRASLHKR